jgi:hypothetical protein
VKRLARGVILQAPAGTFAPIPSGSLDQLVALGPFVAKHGGQDAASLRYAPDRRGAAVVVLAITSPLRSVAIGVEPTAPQIFFHPIGLTIGGPDMTQAAIIPFA